MENYFKLKYIYPPRPEEKASSDVLKLYDNGIFLGQPKLNGSCAELYTNDTFTQKGRHNNTLSNFNMSNDEVMDILGGKGWNLIVGEYMNKSKMGEDGKLFNHKFVIFDQLVYNNDYLLGVTFDERIKLLYDIYKPIDETKYLYKLSDNIYMVKTFYENFETIWKDIIKTDMLEGFVMKRRSAKLDRSGNKLSQFKVRKPTKNYTF